MVIAFLASLAFMANAFAIAPIAMVGEVKGNAFIHHLGKTKKAKVGDQIYNFSEIFTEVGSQVSFSDYYDHQFHLAGSGHLQINGKTVELKSGYLWLQSFNREESFAIETANAHVNYMYGESVISFDSHTGKSQLMTISGGWDFSNKFEKYRTTKLQGGQFSFISKDYADGSPRSPTPVGQASYKKIVGLFGDIKSLSGQASRDFQIVVRVPKNDAHQRPIVKAKLKSRGIASQIEGDQFPARINSTALIRQIAAGGRTVETSVSINEQNAFIRHYKSRVLRAKARAQKKKTKKIGYKRKSTVKVYVFGGHGGSKLKRESGDIRVYDSERFKAAQKRIVKKRTPASVPSVPAKLGAPRNVFESSLRKEYKKQTRHTSEVNDLINELESYDQDYKRSY